MGRLNFTQRRGGMMATVYVPIHITQDELDSLKRYAKLHGYKPSEWRKMLSEAGDLLFSRVNSDLEAEDGN